VQIFLLHSRSSVCLIFDFCGVEDTSWADSAVLGPLQLFDEVGDCWGPLFNGDSRGASLPGLCCIHWLSSFGRRELHGAADSFIRGVF
jgi:hypothetical protein